MDWYENRASLEPGMVFTLYNDDIVKLEYRVPGDGTQWNCAVWIQNRFSYEDYRIEPSDLKDRLSDSYPT